MNESAIERLGVTPLANDLLLIEQLRSRKGLPELLGFFNRTHYEMLDSNPRAITPIWAAVINDDRDAAFGMLPVHIVVLLGHPLPPQPQRRLTVALSLLAGPRT